MPTPKPTLTPKPKPKPKPNLNSAGLNQYRKVQKQQREALPARSLASQPTREACPLFCEVKGLSTATLPLAALALSVSPVLQ